MKYNSDFRYDLQVGQIGEQYLSNILSNELIEVKTDYQAKQTGNVFVEYNSRNKDSGILTTQAKWYCFIISNEKLFFITTLELKKLCRTYLNTKRDVKGGDSNTSLGILLPLSDLL